MKENYKLNPSELKHGWLKMSATIRNKIVKRNMDILNDPNSTDRAIGIATKNLIAINAQNIQLDDNTPKEDKDINITFTND